MSVNDNSNDEQELTWTNVCWTLMILERITIQVRRMRCGRKPHSPKQIDVKHLSPVFDTIPGEAFIANPCVVHQNRNLYGGEYA